MSKKSKKIVICEDDESILEVMELLFSNTGYSVSSFATCDFIEEILEEKPDVLLVDLWIPSLGGEEIIRQIRSIAEYKSLPILLISASNEIEKVAKKVKATGYVKKPFDIHKLVELVEEYIKKPII